VAACSRWRMSVENVGFSLDIRAPFFRLWPCISQESQGAGPEDTDMHYVLFAGIFGLPVVACVGMLVARVLDTFASDEAPTPGPIGKSHLCEIESCVSDLADTFGPVSAEQNPRR
jgi:hypothetical protein